MFAKEPQILSERAVLETLPFIENPQLRYAPNRVRVLRKLWAENTVRGVPRRNDKTIEHLFPVQRVSSRIDQRTLGDVLPLGCNGWHRHRHVPCHAVDWPDGLDADVRSVAFAQGTDRGVVACISRSDCGRIDR